MEDSKNYLAERARERKRIGGVFVNLSNHPSAGWSEEQRRVAVEYDPSGAGRKNEIIDISFPAVDPIDFHSDQIERLGWKVLEKIAEIPSAVTVVYVAGEFRLFFWLVTILQKLQYRVVTASTAREVVEEKDGKKISVFRFCGWMPIPATNSKICEGHASKALVTLAKKTGGIEVIPSSDDDEG